MAFRRDADQRRTSALKNLVEPERRPDGERDPRLHLFLSTWRIRPRTGTISAAGPCMSAPAAARRAASRRRWRACAGPALRRAPRPNPGHQPCGTGAHRPTPPRCSARASWTPSARSPSCSPSATTYRRAPSSTTAAQGRAHAAPWRTRPSCAPAWPAVANAPAALPKLTVADEIENALSYYETTFPRDPASTPT